jgi:hypothetical protein
MKRSNRGWRRLLSRIPLLSDPAPEPSEQPVEEPPASSSQPRFVGFDEQRNYGEQRRADIIFGPDMFDPRTENGARPLSEAIEQGQSDIDPKDFGKTVGEVLGSDVEIDELTRISLRNARSIKVDPLSPDN